MISLTASPTVIESKAGSL